MKVLFLRPMIHASAMPAKGGGERYIEVTLSRLKPLADVDYATTHDLPDIDLDDYDVVHVASMSADGVRRVKRRGGPKVAVTFHSSTLGLARLGWRTGRGGVYRLGQIAAHARDTLRVNAVMAQADAVVASSRPTRDDLLRQNPLARRKVYLNELGIDSSAFTPEGAGDDGFVFYVGRLERSKGIHTLVEALSGAPYRVVVAGTGALAAESKAKAGANFEFVGEVDDKELMRLYRRASVCVFPSLYEGFGLVALESLACGTPTAVSEAFAVRGPAAEMFTWFPIESAPGLRAAVDGLYGTKTPEYSERAHDVVRRHHDASLQAEGLVRLYESLAAGRGVPHQSL